MGKIRARAKHSAWGDPAGDQTPVVRILQDRGKGSVALDYDQIPELIHQLALLLQEHGQQGGDDGEGVSAPPL